MTVDLYAAHCDVSTKHRVNLPHRRVDYGHTLDQHVLTAIGLNKLRAQVMTSTKHAILNRDALFSHFHQRCSVGSLIRRTFFPPVACAPVPGPPGAIVTLSVERTFTSDCDIALVQCIDERGIVHQLDAFPAGEDHGQVVIRILTELDCRTLGDDEIDVALQVDWPGEKL